MTHVARPELDPEVLALLACPQTHQPLSLAAPELLERVNQRARDGKLSREDGTPVRAPLEAGLVSADQRWLYPVEEGIPNLLVSDRIDLSAL